MQGQKTLSLHMHRRGGVPGGCGGSHCDLEQTPAYFSSSLQVTSCGRCSLRSALSILTSCSWLPWTKGTQKEDLGHRQDYCPRLNQVPVFHCGHHSGLRLSGLQALN